MTFNEIMDELKSEISASTARTMTILKKVQSAKVSPKLSDYDPAKLGELSAASLAFATFWTNGADTFSQLADMVSTIQRLSVDKPDVGCGETNVYYYRIDADDRIHVHVGCRHTFRDTVANRPNFLTLLVDYKVADVPSDTGYELRYVANRRPYRYQGTLAECNRQLEQTDGKMMDLLLV